MTGEFGLRILDPVFRRHGTRVPTMSHSLNSLKGGYTGDYIGTTIRDIKGVLGVSYIPHIIPI